MGIFLLSYYIYVYLFLQGTFRETTGLELVHSGNVNLPEDYRDCKGRLFTNINLISCAVLCRYPTAEIMTSFGLPPMDIHDECDWFNYEASSDDGTGNCTLCFTASSLGVTFNAINKTSKIYSKSSILCKYKRNLGKCSKITEICSISVYTEKIKFITSVHRNSTVQLSTRQIKVYAQKKYDGTIKPIWIIAKKDTFFVKK